MLHFSQPLFHSPSTMFSVPVMIAVCCSSTEALVAGNQELLFLCKKKRTSSRKLANTRTQRGDLWAQQSREDIAMAQLVVRADVKGEI